MNFSMRVKRSGGSCHTSPNLEKVSLTSVSSLSILRAFAFPLPANVLTLSQPLKACTQIRPVYVSSPSTVVIFFMSISLVRALELHSCKMVVLMALQNESSKKNICAFCDDNDSSMIDPLRQRVKHEAKAACQLILESLPALAPLRHFLL